jgi:hypothetical protein
MWADFHNLWVKIISWSYFIFMFFLQTKYEPMSFKKVKVTEKNQSVVSVHSSQIYVFGIQKKIPYDFFVIIL